MKKILASLLVVLICLTSITVCITPVQAATNANVTKAIDNLQTKSGYQKGYDYNSSATCFTFAKKVYKALFGEEMGSQKNWYTITTSSMNVVGRLVGVHDNASVKALLKQASPGDILTYSTTCTNGTYATHTAVVEAVDSTGIILYHATDNSGNYTDYTVKINRAYWEQGTTYSTQWYNWFGRAWIGQLTSSSHGMTLYHAKNYDELYGSTYKIKYNANGGTGSVATSSVTYGTNFTIAKSGLSRTGYALAGFNVYRASDKRWYTSGGWATAAEITSGGYTKKQYSPGATYTLDYSWTRGASAGDTYTFYAVWKQSAFNITYNANGGTGTMTSSTINSGGTLTIPECSFTRDGCYFAGYNVYRKSDNSWYVDGKDWYTNTEIYNNGYEKKIYTPGQQYSFSGIWVTEATTGDTFTFYPIWKQNNPSLQFYANYSGANYMSGGIVEDEAFADNFLSRDTSVYTVSVDSTQRLNNQNSLKIVGKSAGASGKDLAFATDTNQGSNAFGNAGDNKKMTLSFWAKSSVEGAKMYLRWGYTSDFKTVTLTTQWQKYTVDMTKNVYDGSVIHPYFDMAGTFYINNLFLSDTSGSEIYKQENDGLIDTISYRYGGTYGNLPTPTREGYTFEGWYTSKIGGTQITADTAVHDSTTRVYAHWEQNISDTPIKTVASLDGKRYELYDNAVSWEEAKALCESKGGHLVTINSAEENTLVYNMIKDQDRIAWIGAYFDAAASNWRWVTDESFDYINWSSGQPSNSAASPEYYAHMHPFDIGLLQVSGTWNDANGVDSWTSHFGKQNSSYICEYEDSAITPGEPVEPEDPVEDITVYFFNTEGWEEIYINYYDKETEAIVFNFMGYEGMSEYGDGYSVKIPSNVTEFFFGSAAGENTVCTVSVNTTLVDHMGFMPTKLNKDGMFEVTLVEYYEGGFYFTDVPEPSPVLKGDVNGDGKVNNKDYSVLLRYLNNWDVEISEEAADVNGDAELNNKDYTLLLRYLNNWDVTFK